MIVIIAVLVHVIIFLGYRLIVQCNRTKTEKRKHDITEKYYNILRTTAEGIVQDNKRLKAELQRLKELLMCEQEQVRTNPLLIN